MSDVDTIALEATHQIENEFARSRNGGRVQRRAAVQIIVANAIHAVSPPEPTEGQAGVLLERAMVRLAPAAIGSCTCETKNDDLAYHRGDCRARLIELAIRDLVDARAVLRAMPLQDGAVTQEERGT